ncbi:MAG: HAMP domain-containing histidine kinase [Lachnospiraceae bacterium]|nr:HAMP domain-containing histidine kinase [Lachnospiraceae bacterium]
MRKKIFYSIQFVVLLGLITFTVVLSTAFYYTLEASVRDSVRNETLLFRGLNSDEALRFVKEGDTNNTRITIVSPSGEVLFDNKRDEQIEDNHIDRPEIKEAFEKGFGEVIRRSDSPDVKTIYMALKLTDGYVVRVARDTSTIIGGLMRILPFAILALIAFSLLSYLTARRLSMKLIEPFINYKFGNVDSNPYEEFNRFFEEIEEGRKSVASTINNLQEWQSNVRNIMNDMSEGVLLLDLNGIVLNANQAVRKIFDWDDKAIGRSAFDIIGNDEVINGIKEGQAGKPPSKEIEIKSHQYNVIYNSTMDLGIGIMFIDITERNAIDQMRKEFSSNITHELRTPLTVITGYSEMLDDDLVKEEDKPKIIHKINAESKRLAELIENISTISNFDERKSKNIFEKVYLNVLIVDVIDSLSMKAEERDIKLDFNGGRGVVYANKTEIRELIYNLMENAIKYNKYGGRVEAKLSIELNQVVLKVKDNGIGIPSNQIPYVFDRFYRAQSETTKNIKGTGLGLSIVKRIVERHQATIEVKSDVGQGTEFIVKFPEERSIIS